MLENPHVKDADKLISFFSDTKGKYEALGEGKSFVSFCQEVLNVPNFNMREVEAALSDLNSIIILISRELSGEKLEQFNRIVKTEVDKIDMWLHGVYNHRISPYDGSLLFGSYSDVASAMSVASKKILRDDYFDLQTEGKGKYTPDFSEFKLDEEDCMNIGTDYIEVGSLSSISYNNVPWTDRNVIWTGNEEEFNNRINAKYRRAKDKRIVAILKGLHEKIGDGLYNTNITVEPGALKSESSYMVMCNKINKGYSITIKRV